MALFPDLGAHLANWRGIQASKLAQAALDHPGIRRAAQALTTDEAWEDLRDYAYGRVDSTSMHAAYPGSYPQPQEQPHREVVAPPHVQRAYQRREQRRMMQQAQQRAMMQAQQHPPVPADPRLVAERIVRVLALKKGSALEISSIVGSLAQRGVHPQVTHAAIMGARKAGWLKAAGAGKIAATAKVVRAGGVPRLDGRRSGPGRSVGLPSSTR